MWSSTFWSHDEPDEEYLRRMGPPDNELPAAVPLNALLARTDDVAIAFLGLQVYTTGVSLDLAVRSRTSGGGRELTELVFEHGPLLAEGRLLIGVEFADGRRASNAIWPDVGPDPQPRSADDIVFHSGSGGGGGRSVDQSWWLSPLPPEGPLTVVLSCGALGIEETSTVLDGSLIRRAVSDVVTLWPWTRPEDPGPPDFPPPDLPPGSWFAER